MTETRPEDCQEPFWHTTHRYCPACTWVEPEPSPETIASLLAAAPSITPGLVDRLQTVIRQCESALRMEDIDETGQAWLRTILRTCHGEDWDEGVVGEFLRGEVESTIDQPALDPS